MELHVWGTEEISIISPECLACSWLVSLIEEDIDIVPSNNTNLSRSGRLPILITETDGQYEGFLAISTYLSEFDGDSEFIGNGSISKEYQLFNRSLITYIDNKIRYINQYNLYISTMNYEQHTRKLFKHYLPFPMMYNQPLKYYNVAQEEVQLIGIGKNTKGLLSFSSNEVADDDIDTTTPISKLHESTLLAKNKKTISLRESKNAFRSMNLLHEYIETITSLYKQIGRPSLQLVQGKFTSCELLLVAYLRSIYSDELPDKSLQQTIEQNHPEFYKYSKQCIAKLNEKIDLFSEPSPHQLPTLFNEIKYQIAKISQP